MSDDSREATACPTGEDCRSPKACHGAMTCFRVEEREAEEPGREATCGAQTYWYESGVQRAKFCGLPATRVTEALDGSRNNGCDRHAAMAVEAGARDVTPPARTTT